MGPSLAALSAFWPRAGTLAELRIEPLPARAVGAPELPLTARTSPSARPPCPSAPAPVPPRPVVVLSFLALYLSNKARLPRWSVTEVCKLLGEAEWYVGTHGGANDQMTILLNTANSVSYNRHSQPELGTTPLPFLRGVHVVLANSLWEVNKSAGGNQSFNMRKGWMQLGDELTKLLIAAVQQAIGQGTATGDGWLAALLEARFGFTPGSPTPLLETRTWSIGRRLPCAITNSAACMKISSAFPMRPSKNTSCCCR